MTQMMKHPELPVIYLLQQGTVELQDSGGHTVAYSEGPLMSLDAKRTAIYDNGD